MKRRRITDQDKQRFAMRHELSIQVEVDCASECWSRRELIAKARKEIGYSPKTSDVDIFTALKIALIRRNK